jgi:alkanesulfonate monooxygenase SsuD/methylene tetrahydromethanopterin reductase-like flavin-dependent oxidoreductase (luciferase family)
MSDGAPAIGLRLAQYGGTWAELVDGALRAERLGFHTLWVNDHIQSAGRVKAEPTFEAFTTLAALAPLTARARLGVAVLSPTHRPPALAAKMATVLDVISGGRLTIGVGTGWDRSEHEAYGIPFGSGAERVAGLRRTLAVIHAMMERPDAAELLGLLAGAPNRPAPVQAPRPPIWVAAHGPKTLRLAVAEADGVLTAFADAPAFAAHRRAADEVREELGRPPLAHALYMYAMPVPSQREADAWLRAEAASLGTTPRALLRWLRTTGIVGSPGRAARAAARAGGRRAD